jgi:hypothetical protein
MLKETFWKAVYSNGKPLTQFNSDGSENKYVDIDRTKIIQFILYRNDEPAVVIHLDPNKKLIYRMRRAQNNKGCDEVVFLAGWQERNNGTNTQMIMFLFEDNHIELVDRFYENHLWFYSINFLDSERIM